MDNDVKIHELRKELIEAAYECRSAARVWVDLHAPTLHPHAPSLSDEQRRELDAALAMCRNKEAKLIEILNELAFSWQT